MDRKMKKSRFQTKLGEKMRESNRLPFYINDPYPIEPETEVTEKWTDKMGELLRARVKQDVEDNESLLIKSYKGIRTLWIVAFTLIGLLLLYLLI